MRAVKAKKLRHLIYKHTQKRHENIYWRLRNGQLICADPKKKEYKQLKRENR